VGAFGVTGRQRAPLLEPVEEPLDDVAVLVPLLVERRRPAAGGAAPGAVVLWSLRSGIVWLMLRRRSAVRIAFEL